MGMWFRHCSTGSQHTSHPWGRLRCPQRCTNRMVKGMAEAAEVVKELADAGAKELADEAANLQLGRKVSMCKLCPVGMFGVQLRHRKHMRTHEGTAHE